MLITPHQVLKIELCYKWAEEIAMQIETGSISILRSDPVISAWAEDISLLIPTITLKNTCTKTACPKLCEKCLFISTHIKEKHGDNLCLNTRSTKQLFMKVREIRYFPVKYIEIPRRAISLFKEDKTVNIVDASDTLVFLPPKLFSFFVQIDKEYQNPVLLTQMVKYLEFEKSQRKENYSFSEEELDQIIHGLKVSFFYDPIQMENSRITLYRKNNQAVEIAQ
ncbi:hypothetical protein NEOKW01_0103 [Nematocida sp. AWRm80]|nr:hypothetical protein NEOKW01_0103 [Nematocida sp. AWRm80]